MPCFKIWKKIREFFKCELSNYAAAHCELMRPSVGRTAEHLDLWCSQQTYHRHNQPHYAFTPYNRSTANRSKWSLWLSNWASVCPSVRLSVPRASHTCRSYVTAAAAAAAAALASQSPVSRQSLVGRSCVLATTLRRAQMHTQPTQCRRRGRGCSAHPWRQNCDIVLPRRHNCHWMCRVPLHGDSLYPAQAFWTFAAVEITPLIGDCMHASVCLRGRSKATQGHRAMPQLFWLLMLVRERLKAFVG